MRELFLFLFFPDGFLTFRILQLAPMQEERAVLLSCMSMSSMHLSGCPDTVLIIHETDIEFCVA